MIVSYSLCILKKIIFRNYSCLHASSLKRLWYGCSPSILLNLRRWEKKNRLLYAFRSVSIAFDISVLVYVLRYSSIFYTCMTFFISSACLSLELSIIEFNLIQWNIDSIPCCFYSYLKWMRLKTPWKILELTAFLVSDWLVLLNEFEDPLNTVFLVSFWKNEWILKSLEI